MEERRGVFSVPTQQRTFQFTYQPRGTQPAQVFKVPPLDATALISTPGGTGVADQAALTVIPVNQALCNREKTDVPPPRSFDCREEFADFVAPIINQGNCGSCWAIASTRAFASRYAFFTNQKVEPLSAAYLLYCLRASTFSHTTDLKYGCYGGTLLNAFWFLLRNGTVRTSCLKYDHLGSWDPSNPELQLLQVIDPDTSTKLSSVTCPMVNCPSGPRKGEPAQPWLYKLASAYIVAGTKNQSGASEENIRREIWQKGPVATGFEVRQDFLDYWKDLLESKRSGDRLVYEPQPVSASNPIVGNHAVQLLGWSTTRSGKQYWIVANSWGASNTGVSPRDLVDYGHNGYFLMVRGINAGALESNVVAGMPLVHPVTVNAGGVPAFMQDVEMCDIVAYEINRTTFDQLGFSIPRELPQERTMYEFTVPPLSPERTGTIRRFPQCPADRSYRCELNGMCVTTPSECGTSIPTQGSIKPVQMLLTTPELAVSREVSLKYLAEVAAQLRQRKAGKRVMVDTAALTKKPRWVFPVVASLTAAVALLVCVLVGLMLTDLLNQKT